jgi:hypothetical protein
VKTSTTAPAVALLLACTSAPSTTSTSASSSGAGGATASSSVGVGGVAQDAGSDVEQPLPEPDSGTSHCNENPGVACVKDSDCPNARGCSYYWTCEALPDGTMGCRLHPIDGGP